MSRRPHVSAMTASEPLPAKSVWSGFRLGMRLGLPVVPGIMAFGLVVGAAAARQGLSFVQSMAMNFLVCSGIAQLVALEIWPAVLSWGVIITIALLTAVVGARLFLMSVAMRPWFGQLPAWQAYAGLFFLTDATWLIAMRGGIAQEVDHRLLRVVTHTCALLPSCQTIPSSGFRRRSDKPGGWK